MCPYNIKVGSDTLTFPDETPMEEATKVAEEHAKNIPFPGTALKRQTSTSLKASTQEIPEPTIGDSLYNVVKGAALDYGLPLAANIGASFIPGGNVAKILAGAVAGGLTKAGTEYGQRGDATKALKEGATWAGTSAGAPLGAELAGAAPVARVVGSMVGGGLALPPSATTWDRLAGAIFGAGGEKFGQVIGRHTNMTPSPELTQIISDHPELQNVAQLFLTDPKSDARSLFEAVSRDGFLKNALGDKVDEFVNVITNIPKKTIAPLLEVANQANADNLRGIRAVMNEHIQSANAPRPGLPQPALGKQQLYEQLARVPDTGSLPFSNVPPVENLATGKVIQDQIQKSLPVLRDKAHKEFQPVVDLYNAADPNRSIALNQDVLKASLQVPKDNITSFGANPAKPALDKFGKALVIPPTAPAPSSPEEFAAMLETLPPPERIEAQNLVNAIQQNGTLGNLPQLMKEAARAKNQMNTNEGKAAISRFQQALYQESNRLGIPETALKETRDNYRQSMEIIGKLGRMAYLNPAEVAGNLTMKNALDTEGKEALRAAGVPVNQLAEQKALTDMNSELKNNVNPGLSDKIKAFERALGDDRITMENKRILDQHLQTMKTAAAVPTTVQEHLNNLTNPPNYTGKVGDDAIKEINVGKSLDWLKKQSPEVQQSTNAIAVNNALDKLYVQTTPVKGGEPIMTFSENKIENLRKLMPTLDLMPVERQNEIFDIFTKGGAALEDVKKTADIMEHIFNAENYSGVAKLFDSSFVTASPEKISQLRDALNRKGRGFILDNLGEAAVSARMFKGTEFDPAGLMTALTNVNSSTFLSQGTLQELLKNKPEVLKSLEEMRTLTKFVLALPEGVSNSVVNSLRTNSSVLKTVSEVTGANKIGRILGSAATGAAGGGGMGALGGPLGALATAGVGGTIGLGIGVPAVMLPYITGKLMLSNNGKRLRPLVEYLRKVVANFAAPVVGGNNASSQGQ